MGKKRPCRICRRWFLPSPRARGRQTTCCETSCQRERHRRACAAWHTRERESLGREQLAAAVSAVTAAAVATPLGKVPEVPANAAKRLRDAVPAEVPTVIAFFAQVLDSRRRDTVGAQGVESTRQLPKDRRPDRRDGIAQPAAGP